MKSMLRFGYNIKHIKVYVYIFNDHIKTWGFLAEISHMAALMCQLL